MSQCKELQNNPSGFTENSDRSGEAAAFYRIPRDVQLYNTNRKLCTVYVVVGLCSDHTVAIVFHIKLKCLQPSTIITGLSYKITGCKEVIYRKHLALPLTVSVNCGYVKMSG